MKYMAHLHLKHPRTNKMSAINGGRGFIYKMPTMHLPHEQIKAQYYKSKHHYVTGCSVVKVIKVVETRAKRAAHSIKKKPQVHGGGLFDINRYKQFGI